MDFANYSLAGICVVTNKLPYKYKQTEQHKQMNKTHNKLAKKG